MHFEYRTRGTCASKVIFNIENNIVTVAAGESCA